MTNWPRGFLIVQKLQGRLVVENKSETMVVPTELSTTTKPLLTNETVRGDLLREYERKFANLPDGIKLIRLYSNVGITKTLAKGKYFSTLDDAELTNWVAHVESTLYLETTHHPK